MDASHLAPSHPLVGLKARCFSSLFGSMCRPQQEEKLNTQANPSSGLKQKGQCAQDLDLGDLGGELV